MKKTDRQKLAEKMKTSCSLTEKGNKVLRNHYCGGYYNDFLFFHHGQGSQVWDPDGNQYIDYAMGLGPLILGHSHPTVLTALEEVIHSGAVHSFGEENEILFAELMVDAIPCADQVAFTNSGTEATMHAIKIARAFTGKDKIAKFEGCYHGTHDYAQINGRYTVSGPKGRPEPAPDFNGIPGCVMDSIIPLAFNAEETFQIIEGNKEQLAAVLVEPLPLICPLDFSSFLQRLREITAKYGIILIFDEVITGFRLGYTGYQGYFNIIPDMATYGKIIGGGMPVGAIAGKQEFMNCLDFTNKHLVKQKVSIVGTFSGNRITCAAGTAVLKYLKAHQEIYAQMEQKADYLRKEIEAYAEQLGFPLRTRGIGSSFTLYLHKNDINEPRDTQWYTNMNKLDDFRKLLLLHGIALGDVGMVFLSAAHTDEDCEKTIAAFKSCMDKLY